MRVAGLLVLLSVACAPPAPGAAPPGVFVCVNEGEATGSCQTVCAARGSSCIVSPPDDHECANDPRFFSAASAAFVSVPDCTRTTGSRASYSTRCDEPLFAPRGPAGSTFLPLSVACCCAL
jgi:hypothetical protein